MKSPRDQMLPSVELSLDDLEVFFEGSDKKVIESVKLVFEAGSVAKLHLVLTPTKGQIERYFRAAANRLDDSFKDL